MRGEVQNIIQFGSALMSIPTFLRARLESSEIIMRHPKHLDRKCDSEVRIGDRASFAEDTLNSLLGP
jgi:hypothetical protein